VLSRSQVYEFRTIGTKEIAAQLRVIADAEGISIGDESLQLIARDAEGSMRDAQTKLDQVIAFTGTTIGGQDVSTVLGLVGRDLLFDAVQAVGDEDAAAAFAVAGRAVEWGYDLRAVCRELSRLVRDLLVVSVDPSRVEDPEIAGEGERDRLKALAARFSREDLLRAFDVLTKAETDIRTAAQPRHHLEMAFLRWIYLRKLVPIEDLIAGTGGAQRSTRTPAPVTKVAASPPEKRADVPVAPAPSAAPGAPGAGRNPRDANLKDALLAEIRKSKMVFYNTVVAQAQRIDVAGDRVTFTFSSNHRALREMFDQNRGWIEAAAQQVSGRPIAVVARQNGQGDSSEVAASSAPEKEADAARDRKSALREQALADAGVQAVLEVFPAEIRDVEEM
jgi:DNA polymerase III gamma/tau subunit